MMPYSKQPTSIGTASGSRSRMTCGDGEGAGKGEGTGHGQRSSSPMYCLMEACALLQLPSLNAAWILSAGLPAKCSSDRSFTSQVRRATQEMPEA